MKKEKRIPTILGLILLLGSVIGGVALTSRNTDNRSSASGDCTPVNPQVTNITNSSFTVSFTTSSSCLSNVIVENRTISDVRFVNTGRGETADKIHYFEVNNLKENTDYTFAFVNNGTKYTHTNYKAQTAQKPSSSIPTSNLAWGRVFTADLKPAADAIVYLKTDGSSPLSAFVTSKGYWNISLATSFNDRKDNWFTPPANQPEDISVVSSDNQTTQVVNNTSRNNPVPDIIIGQNKLTDQPVTEYGNEDSGHLNSVTQAPVNRELSITNPKENEPVFTSKPDIFGFGPIGKDINIQVVSGTVIKGTTTTLKDGSWHWSPSQDLTSGENTLIVTAENPTTQSISTITRKFTVVGQGNVGLSFTASGSATLTPSPTVTPTTAPTVAPTSVPTTVITPTATIAPTSIPTVKPTVRTAKPSTSSGMPVTGATAPTFILISLAIVFIIASYLYL